MRRYFYLFLATCVLSIAGIANAQGGGAILHGNGDPRTLTPPANCGFARFYVDDSTQRLYTSPQGSPCVWADVSAFAPSYTAPVSASWSTLGTGCTNSTGVTFGGVIALQVIGQASTANTCGLQAAATGTFTHVFVINTALAVTTNQFSSVLVGFTDGTKYEACGLGYNSGALGTTAIESTTLAGVVAGANGTVGAGFLAGPFAWFRLRSTAGATLACDYSPDQGQSWINVFNDTTPFLTVSSVFFGANSRGATASQYGWLVSYQ